MKLSLVKELSVGLAKSDLSLTTALFGTGVNLTLEIEVTTTPTMAALDKARWQAKIDQLAKDLDHVHLDLDHPELKAKKIGEQDLLTWIQQQIHSPELLKVTLNSNQNYSVSWTAY